MGLGPFGGHSHEKHHCCCCSKKNSFSTYTPPNPNPSKFTVEGEETSKHYSILTVKYDGCTNFEGRKILVLELPPGVLFLNQSIKYLDPHFTNTQYSPIARFIPNKNGKRMARQFVNLLEKTREWA